MDKLVRLLAEGVMGWHIHNTMWLDSDNRVWANYWNPLEDWNDCMMLVEKMHKDGFDFEYRNSLKHIHAKFEHGITWESGFSYFDSAEENGRKAICKAIAKARGIKYE